MCRAVVPTPIQKITLPAAILGFISVGTHAGHWQSTLMSAWKSMNLASRPSHYFLQTFLGNRSDLAFLLPGFFIRLGKQKQVGINSFVENAAGLGK